MTIYEWSSLARATPLYRHPDLPYGEAMNPKENLDNAFDTLAEGELRRLERALSGFDPDEVDASIGGDVLTLTLGDGATIGAIGYEGRRDYGVIGNVTNMAARLCGEAKGGQILVSQRVQGFVSDTIRTEPVGELTLKGFHRPVPAFLVLGPADVLEQRAA